MKTEIELMRAALTAIEVWSHRDPETLPIVAELRAAVERADNQAKKQESDFDKWWERTYGGKTCRVFAEDSWKTAQQSERERLKNVVAELLDPKDPWIHYSTLLERIDGPDDNSGEG